VAVERMRWVLVVGRHARGGRGLLVARHGVVSSRRKHQKRVRALDRRQQGGWVSTSRTQVGGEAGSRGCEWVSMGEGG
jgi:hypothetical protein